MFPQAVFLEREKQVERKGLDNLCTLGWSLVLPHIEMFLSQMASFQRVEEEGALLWGQLLLGTWHIWLLSLHHAKRMSNLLGI